jgi:hypothetical protein
VSPVHHGHEVAVETAHWPALLVQVGNSTRPPTGVAAVADDQDQASLWRGRLVGTVSVASSIWPPMDGR